VTDTAYKPTIAPGALSGIGSGQTSLVNITSAKQGIADICLLDVVTIDGNSYHWANAQVTAPPVYTGNVPPWQATLKSPPANWNTYYFPWLLNVSGMHFYRSTQADVANFLIQNVSGNSLQRDLAGLLAASSFEGAIFAFRIWEPSAQAVSFEMHGRLTVTNAGETTTQFGTEPLFNSATADGVPYEFSETCQWTYAGPECGDTTNNPCNNCYSTCRQLTRFCGVLNTFQVNLSPTVADINTVTVNRARMV
jgi:phage-related protein